MPRARAKSTLLRTINLIERVDDGQILLNGDDLTDPTIDPDAARARIGVVFQHFNLFPHLRVIDNVTLAARKVHGMPKAEAYARGTELLEQLGLGAKAREFPDRLSGAAAAARRDRSRRDDEPRAAAARREITSALDPQLVGEVLDLVRVSARPRVDHAHGHARDVVRARGRRRIVFMRGGRIVEQGTPAQILDDPQAPRTIAFLERERRGGAL